MLSIEQLKKARKIGATHFDSKCEVFRKSWLVYSLSEWKKGLSEADYHKHPDIQPIDFTPLDDYYADKAVDIAATGGEESELPDGWHRDDETGGLKPLGKASKQGMKHDNGKPRLSLVPPIALNEMAKVMTFGAEKYEAHNWRKVEGAQERYLDALLRHAIAYVGGERTDPESGLPTMAHVMCNAAFLIELESNK